MSGFETAHREPLIYGGLAVLLAALWLAVLAARPLFNPDEGRYAEIPREMLSRGDWVIPHLNGLAYIEKPPLQYWATAMSYRLLGVNQFAARLYTAMTAWGTIALLWLAGRRCWGAAAGWRAAAVLTSLLLFLVLGQLLTLDMSLTFYLALSLVGFLLAQQGTSDDVQGLSRAGQRPAWMLLAWAAAALGVLTKGVVAALIPAAVLLLYSLYSRDFSPWGRLRLAWGVPLFLAITVPWHWFAARRSADFLQFFFVHEHLARYLTPTSDRQEAWWFFAAVFLAGSLPWIVPALRVLATGWRRRAPLGGGEFQPQLFLWIWVVFIGVFFSLSDSKLMPYILPAMPALALMIAASPNATLKRDCKFTAGLTLVAGAALGAAALNLPRLIPASPDRIYFLPLAMPLLQIAVLLLASGAFVLMRCAQHATRAAVFLSVGWCAAWLLLMRAAIMVAPIYSGVDLAAALRTAGTADVAGATDTVGHQAPLYSVDTYDQTLPFYSWRTVTLVRYRGELDYGLRHAPDSAIPDLAEFIRQWSAQSAAFAVMETPMFDDLRRRGVPMRVLAQNARRILVARQ